MAEHGLSEDEVADLKEAFSMYDVDGGGKFYAQRMQLVRARCSRPSHGGVFMMLSSP